MIEVGQDRGIPLNITILPEYLQELGYSTHAIGKWHLGYSRSEYLPTNRGFLSHFGYWAGMQDYYSHTMYKVNVSHREIKVAQIFLGWLYKFRGTFATITFLCFKLSPKT